MHPTLFPTRRNDGLATGAAFTLIELLVVISIIAVLAGLLLPVVSKVTQNAYKVSAKSTETQIVAAVNSYMTDYGQYPVASTHYTNSSGSGNATQDYTFGTDDHNAELFNVLRALVLTDPNSGQTTTGTPFLNSRQISYFDGKTVKNNNMPRDGFISVQGGKSNNANKTPFVVGDLVDPWGNVYFVRIDTGYNGGVRTPYADATKTADDAQTASSNPSDPSILHTGVISYSYGLDAQIGNGGNPPAAPYTVIYDDVVSWQ